MALVVVIVVVIIIIIIIMSYMGKAHLTLWALFSYAHGTYLIK